MTCAARPTFNPAQGGEEVGYYRMKEGTRQLSVRDMAGHTRLKLRAQGQGSSAEVSGKDMVAELRERELKALDKKALSGKADPSDVASSAGESGGIRGVLENVERDADDVVPDAESSDDSSDDDDEDETAELMKELERIKKEREEEAAAKAVEEQARLEQERKEAMLRGNPLLGGAAAGGAMGVKRRWDDDVVFRHQARNEPEVKKRFINDTIRNDFHKKFLNKYVK